MDHRKQLKEISKLGIELEMKLRAGQCLFQHLQEESLDPNGFSHLDEVSMIKSKFTEYLKDIRKLKSLVVSPPSHERKQSSPPKAVQNRRFSVRSKLRSKSLCRPLLSRIPEPPSVDELFCTQHIYVPPIKNIHRRKTLMEGAATQGLSNQNKLHGYAFDNGGDGCGDLELTDDLTDNMGLNKQEESKKHVVFADKVDEISLIDEVDYQTHKNIKPKNYCYICRLSIREEVIQNKR
jgi:hypothetical protein